MRRHAQPGAGRGARASVRVGSRRHRAGAGPFSRLLTQAREFRGRILGRLQYLTHAYRRALFGGASHAFSSDLDGHTSSYSRTNGTHSALPTHLFIAHYAVGSEALHLDDAIVLEEAIV